MKRTTKKNEYGGYQPVEQGKILFDCLNKLGQLEDFEEEIGISFITLFGVLKEKKAYLCFVDDEWCVCDMQTDAILDLNNGQ